MSDSNENQKAKAHLIKQPKAPQGAPAPAPAPAPAEDHESAEKRKVVVVKKKVVVKKPQARVVAHHEGEEAKPETVHPARTEHPAEPHAEARPEAAPAASGPAAEAPRRPAPAQPRPATGDAQRPSSVQGRVGGIDTQRPASVQGRVGGYDTQRPNSVQGRVGGYDRSGGYQGRPGGYSGGPGGPGGPGGQPGGYQGRPGGYQGGPSGGPGAPGGQGGYQGRPGGYQGGQGGYQGGQGGQGGYQGRPGGYQGGPGRPGGYQGGPGRPGGYSGGPGRPGGPGGPGGRPGYGPRPGGPGRPGGFGGRPGGPGAGGPPPGPARPAGKRLAKGKKGSYVKRDEDMEKALQFKKKSGANLNAIPSSVDIMETVSVSDLARKMNIKPSELIGKLMSLGVMATINQQIDADTATILAAEYNCEVKVVSLYDETVIEKEADAPDSLVHRPPIVTVMGHVDHGKTKLLDAIRKTDVVSREFGGITQHIGAYMVTTPKGRITFLDTPGHEAFTKMRARGSQVTDIVVLVVAANDGVMPQTLEALDHAKAAKVPIIVAINKIDLPEANPDRVMTQLAERGLTPEAWGGETIFCQISALQKKGIDELLDAILLQAELLQLTANYDCRAEGKVIEAKIDHGRGIVSTIIVERGSLRVGDCFVAGVFPGKVRAMFDERGEKVDVASPSQPVEVIGFEGMPNAGDPFEAVEDEKFARLIAGKRQELKRSEVAKTLKKVTLDNLYDTIHEGNVQELKVVIKGDVTGSVEALKNSLEKLSTREVRLVAIRAAAGAINEDDVMLASASDAIIIGFNVRPTPKAKLLADQEKVDIRKYNIIYRAVEEIQTAMEGMLAPEYKEQDIGQVEVRELFKVPKIGVIAGCYVLEGVVKRAASVRVIREGIEVHQGKLGSLKRFKDDAKEVAAGYECGVGIDGWNDLKVGDVLEIFEQVAVTRKLGDVDKAEKAEKAKAEKAAKAKAAKEAKEAKEAEAAKADEADPAADGETEPDAEA